MLAVLPLAVPMVVAGPCYLVLACFEWLLTSLMALFSTAWYGTVQYGSLLGGFPLGTTSARIPSDRPGIQAFQAGFLLMSPQ